MMIIMNMEATQEQIASVVARIEANGFKAHLSQGEERTVIGVVGNNPDPDARAVHALARHRPHRAHLAAV